MIAPGRPPRLPKPPEFEAAEKELTRAALKALGEIAAALALVALLYRFY